MPRNDELTSSPADTLFSYKLRVPDVDDESVTVECDHAMFKVGDRVWIRDPSRRYDVPSSLGTVTGIVSVQCVEVDCISRHVRDLRPAIVPNCGSGQDAPQDDSSRFHNALYLVPNFVPDFFFKTTFSKNFLFKIMH